MTAKEGFKKVQKDLINFIHTFIFYKSKKRSLSTIVSFRITIIIDKDLSLKTANAMSIKGEARNSTFPRGLRMPKASG